MGKSRATIELIARALYARDGKLLVCRSVKGGYSYLPGGHIEFGESAAAAIERELQEECGVAFAASICALVSENSFSTREEKHHEVNFVFHVEPKAPLVATISSQEPGIVFEWLDLAAVVDADLRPESIKAWLVAGGSTDLSCGWIPMVSQP